MSFISDVKANEIKGKLISDLSLLGKIYKAKKGDYYRTTVSFGMEQSYIKDGWELDGAPLKTKVKIKKKKSVGKKFEDDVWCQMYELGYRHLNSDDLFYLPFGKEESEKKQIDIVAIGEDEIILIECKASDKVPSPKYPLKDEFELLGFRLDGFRKTLRQIFGEDKRIKFIFATRNYKIDTESIDFQRLLRTNSFYFSDTTYDYFNRLIENYKDSAIYQFKGLLFKNQLINANKIEVPAIEGDMGNKKYYMFSIEPELLLKMGYVLHRTRANNDDMPTYQRLLVPNRLKGITKFIDDGGYFPNSIIINFNANKNHDLIFESSGKSSNSNSKHGILKIPNAYSIAYIIDGQHRLYGYAGSQFKASNTIPVVAFVGLSSPEQLRIFMDINQNQKAVSPSLVLTLEEDLFWDSDKTDSRLKALKSSIVKNLSNGPGDALFNKITDGEDKSSLSLSPFYKALTDSGLVPRAKGNKYVEESVKYSLYNTGNHNHDEEMTGTKSRISALLTSCFNFVQSEYPKIFNRDQYFIFSNRGAYAFIYVIGSLNSYLTEKGIINRNTKNEDRFFRLEPYLKSLLDEINQISKQEEDKYLGIYGSKAEVSWSRFFQSLIHKNFSDYKPVELTEWLERNDAELQEKARKYGVSIEKSLKKMVLEKVKVLFGENWDLEINSIKRQCIDRAEAEMEKYYKEFKKKKVIEWTEMFFINDYKKIISDYWGVTPIDKQNTNNFRKFSDDFSIDIGEGVNGVKVGLKWISYFNSFRNSWAHEGTKEQGLNKEEVMLLEKIYNHFEKMN